MNEINIKISNHASQRYAERIMSKEDTDVQRFMVTHEQKIHDDIEKLIEYGQIIYSGKQKTRDGKTNNVDVYLNGTWVVLVDAKKKQLSDSHAKQFRYASSNTKVATVNANGKITAKKKGTCYIYVYAKNGYAKKIKVTVK